jgi:hypothetical protein
MKTTGGIHSMLSRRMRMDKTGKYSWGKLKSIMLALRRPTVFGSSTCAKYL